MIRPVFFFLKQKDRDTSSPSFELVYMCARSPAIEALCESVNGYNRQICDETNEKVVRTMNGV